MPFFGKIGRYEPPKACWAAPASRASGERRSIGIDCAGGAAASAAATANAAVKPVKVRMSRVMRSLLGGS